MFSVRFYYFFDLSNILCFSGILDLPTLETFNSAVEKLLDELSQGKLKPLRDFLQKKVWYFINDSWADPFTWETMLGKKIYYWFFYSSLFFSLAKYTRNTTSQDVSWVDSVRRGLQRTGSSAKTDYFKWISTGTKMMHWLRWFIFSNLDTAVWLPIFTGCLQCGARFSKIINPIFNGKNEQDSTQKKSNLLFMSYLEIISSV